VFIPARARAAGQRSLSNPEARAQAGAFRPERPWLDVRQIK